MFPPQHLPSDVREYKEYYFGAVDQYRIVLEKGARGVIFTPSQSEGMLNYFMYPYAEIDGQSLDYFDAKNFRFSVYFREI